MQHYPKEFKNRVKKSYPDRADLHQHLNNDDAVVGHYLRLLAESSSEEDESVIKERKQLYEDWQKIWKKMRKKG